MVDFEEGFRQAVRNGFCDIARAGVAGGLLYTGLGAPTVALGLAGLATAGASAMAYALYCGQPPPPEFYRVPDWTGGQCPDVPYRIRFQFDSYLAFTTPPTFSGTIVVDRNVVGPITEIDMYIDEDDFGALRGLAVAREGSFNEVIFEGQEFGDGNNFWFVDNFSIQVARVDGLPDVCGNPPVLPPPLVPGDNIFDTDIVFDNDIGVEVSVPITITLGLPRVDIRNEINMPINVDVGFDIPIDVNGTVNFYTGDFTINVNPPGSSPPGDDPEPPTVLPPGTPSPPPGVPMPSPPPPPDVPTADKQRIIKAVIVTVQDVDVEATTIFQVQNPDIYAPSLGYVQFFIRYGDTGAWTSDIPVKNRRNFITCPWELGATDVRGTPRGTAAFTLTPVYTLETYMPQFPPEAVDP